MGQNISHITTAAADRGGGNAMAVLGRDSNLNGIWSGENYYPRIIGSRIAIRFCCCFCSILITRISDEAAAAVECLYKSR